MFLRCLLCLLMSSWLLAGPSLMGQTPDPATSPAAQETGDIDFAADVRPILSDRCFACHGPDAEHRQADLRVDELASLLEDRGGYQAVQPGEPAQSELLRRILSDDPSEQMPPPEIGKPLTAAEKEQLQTWIAAGAAWEQHWAYQPPQWQAAPHVVYPDRQAAEMLHWIDAFIAEPLLAAGGQFSPRADLTTLARRLSFDLTGLPPEADRVAALQADPTPLALESYIDSLLGSPAFGERMASYWLDLVRFADTVGYHGDQEHHITPYRDYVIDAFNDNRGFDQFTVEQLAGDLLPNPTDEQIIATGYNRLLQTSHEGGVQPKEYLAIYAADRVRNVSLVWMGATIGCAQCHDHKFDPYTAHDFYAMAAFFADVDEAQHFRLGSNDLPTKRPPEQAFLNRAERLQLAQAEQQLHRLRADGSSPHESSNVSIADAEQRVAAIQAVARKTMITQSITPRPVRLLPRGNWQDDSGPLVTPAIPAFLGKINSANERATRLELARWLTDSQSGAGLLTARVQVNRLWMLMFGSGLSPAVDDFGGQGEPPSHPELLDRLAIEFVRSGWDVKHMLRQIALSRTYQQSSLETDWHRRQDPLNRLWGRQNRFRVPAEAVRDTALSCSQLLVHRIGGASVKPYQPAGYYRHLNFPTRDYAASQDADQWRRGVYVHWQRQFLHPMFRAFDAPTREECTAQRPQSNTPLAALVWLNDPSLVEAAQGLAVRVLGERSDDRERLARMFQIGTSRPPDAAETQLLHELLEQARSHYQTHTADSQALLSVGLWEPASAPPPHEWAAWTTVARAVLNLNETYTRN